MAEDDCDAVIVGAGLAGAAAALALGEAGWRVRVLEARERVGGRAFTRAFSGQGPALEFGGSWIAPSHEMTRGLVRRFGCSLRPTGPLGERRWFSDGRLRRDAAVAPELLAEHTRVLAQIAADAERYKAGEPSDTLGRPLAGLSFAGYLAGLRAGPATLAELEAWWCLSGDGDPDVVAATEFLGSCAYGDGTPESLMQVLTDTIAEGASELAARLLAGAGAELRLAGPVAAIAQDGEGVTVTLSDGQRHRARTSIVATGINPLRALAFAPPLPAGKAAAVAEGHHGRAVKLWLAVKGVVPGTLASGEGPGLRWFFAERADADGATLLAAFGLALKGFRPDEAGVRAALARFFPEATLLAWDWHDWVEDPWARGAWVAAAAGREALLVADSWAPEGRIAFASSDIAPLAAGWFEGAVASGQAAAAALMERFGRPF